jgi:SAM-dependent methyltransferase
MIKTLKQFISPFRKIVYKNLKGRPWSYGYNDTRWELINNTIRNEAHLNQFAQNLIPNQYAIGFDERLVEYPWLFSRLIKLKGQQVLDAGSTFNFPSLVSHPAVQQNHFTIYTFYPEQESFNKQRISYVYGDLRSLPFKDNHFDCVVCQSTIEHIDMDNSIYGYELASNKEVTQKSYEYEKVVHEIVRVLTSNGKLLLTFPYGKFENHGFFQQFDAEMLGRISNYLHQYGQPSTHYFKYTPQGWIISTASDCNDCESYNPHTGKGIGNDGAAHSRAIACIEFVKK